MLLVFRTRRGTPVHGLGGVRTYAVLFYGLLGTGPPWMLPRRVLGLVGSGGLPAGRFLRLSLTMRGLAWWSALPRGLLVLRLRYGPLIHLLLGRRLRLCCGRPMVGVGRARRFVVGRPFSGRRCGLLVRRLAACRLRLRCGRALRSAAFRLLRAGRTCGFGCLRGLLRPRLPSGAQQQAQRDQNPRRGQNAPASPVIILPTTSIVSGVK